MAALSLVGWGAGGRLARARHKGFPARSQTGARESGSFEGNRFPVTTGAGDGGRAIDLASWRLEVIGRVDRPLSLSYQEIVELPSHPQIEVLDCTIGWYTEQVWRGVRLQDLLDRADLGAGAAAVRLSAQEGYSHSLTLKEAKRVLLATHVGGEPLAHAHGFPLRAVVPTHRGWFWVKWLRTIEVLGRWNS
ncbi:MAG: molybdopterin-dependent oxidoreductase [Anaerolineales bacterium]